MTTLTQRLVDRALDGDPTAQRTLVAELTPTIQWSVAKMLRRWRTGTAAGRDLRQEVEDMVQEVFVELFEKQLLEGGFARSVELLVDGEWEVGKEVVPLPAWEADLSTVHAGPFVYLRRLMAQGRAKPPEGVTVQAWSDAACAMTCRAWRVFPIQPQVQLIVRRPHQSWGSAETPPE